MADNNTFSQALNSNYPALGFRFKVTFNGIAGNVSCPFQTVSMLSVSNKSLLIVDGGDNAKEYKLPTKHKFKDVKLVRGLMTNNVQLLRWLDNLGLDESGRIKTAIVIIELLSTDNSNQILTIEKWSLYDCFPTSFSLGEFNAQKNAVVLETVTLAYSKYERESVGGQLNYY